MYPDHLPIVTRTALSKDPLMIADFGSCVEVDEATIAHALRPARSLDEPLPRERVLALIERMAHVSAPDQGAPRVLRVLGRIAPCSWVDGRLEVRLRRIGNATSIEALVDDGLSLSRLRPRLTFNAPFTEFAAAIAERPHDLHPLVARRVGADAIDLTLPETFDENRDAGVDPSFRRVAPQRLAPTSDPGILAKPTVKMPAVRLPKEAFRDDEE